jgi:hypothetical protein
MRTMPTTRNDRREESPPRRFYWFSYATTPSRELRRDGLDIHKTRDGGMFADLAVSLAACGYQYGGRVLNLPPEYATDLREERRLPCAPEDFVVLPTRPPLDDAESELKKLVIPSDTIEERKVFAVLRRVFRALDRSKAILSPGLTAPWDAEARPYREAHFQMYGPAHVVALQSRRKPEDAFSLCYLVCARGPDFRLLTAFGMSGTMTSLWGELLRGVYAADLQQWIRSPADRVVICRIAPPEKYPYPFCGHNFDNIRHKIVVDAVFSPPSPARGCGANPTGVRPLGE